MHKNILIEIAHHIVQFLKNKGIHITVRLATIVLSLTALVILNDVTGFTRNYLLNSRLDQIIKLKQIDHDVLKNDSSANKKYLEIKNELINNQSVTGKLIDQAKNVTMNLKTTPISNSSWLYLSTMAYFYVVVIIFLAVLVSTIVGPAGGKGEKIKTIASIVVAIIAIFIIGTVYKLLVSLIPCFINFEWINYSVYFFLPFLFTYFIQRNIRKKTRLAKTA